MLVLGFTATNNSTQNTTPVLSGQRYQLRNLFQVCKLVNLSPAPQVLRKICWFIILSPSYSTAEGSSSDVLTLLTSTNQARRVGHAGRWGRQEGARREGWAGRKGWAGERAGGPGWEVPEGWGEKGRGAGGTRGRGQGREGARGRGEKGQRACQS